MPAESEARIGAQEHQKIIASYGVVDNAQLQALVNKVGARIVPHTERQDVEYTFTVLDSPEVNAFALPGGFVYVTRGILALADSEDELAAVIAHEIGHVTARHSAERYSRSVATGLGASVLAILLDSEGAADLLGLGSNLYLSSYSRGQEHEADDLGIRYLTRAGYDPQAMSSFLTTMDRYHELQQLRLGQHARQQASYFSTHPVTRDRISRTRLTAANAGSRQHARVVEPYMTAIKGMIFGDSAAQGYEYRNMFVHPQLGFGFDLPQGYIMQNSQKSVVILSPNSNAMAVMDGGRMPQGQSLANYMQTVWLPNKRLDNVQQRMINGRPAILAQYTQNIKGQAGTVFVAAIQWNGAQIFRFQIAVPYGLPAHEQQALLNMATSFRALTQQELQLMKPKRLVTVRSSGMNDVSNLAGKMPFDDGLNEQRFRVLNNLPIGAPLQQGQIYKTVVQ